MMITVTVDDDTATRLLYISKLSGKDIESLALVAVEGGAEGFFSANPSHEDPAKPKERTSH